MRALLIVNPTATTANAKVSDVLARALASEVKLDVVATRRRGHAAELAQQAAVDGLDVVIAMGGDGTVNEVVNGLLHDGPRTGLPSLAVVPAGSTNVFARALGLPPSAVEATGHLIEGLRGDHRRALGLGRADGRWFTFNAGLGLDAGAVRRVERARARGHRATQPLYVRSALEEFVRGPGRGRPVLTLERPGHDPVALALAVVCNTDPWTYLGARTVRPCPEASFDLGLDLYGLTSTTLPALLHHVHQVLSPRPRLRGSRLHLVHDAPELLLRSTVPLPFQLDGDDLGDRTEVRLTSVPHALSVVV